MDALLSKENVPASGADDQVVPVGKLGLQTPRQPLMDLKQVRSSQSIDTHTVKATLTYAVTPLCTPTAHKSHRKIHPNALVFVEDESRQTACSRKNVTVSKEPLSDISETAVDELVDHVLATAAKQLAMENSKKDKEVCTKPKDERNSEVVNNKTSDTLRYSNESHIIQEGKNLLQSNASGTKCEQTLPPIESTSTDSEELCKLTETSFLAEELLADVSLCENSSASLADSSKSEEELLASVENTPAVIVTRESTKERPEKVEDVKVTMTQVEDNNTLMDNVPSFLDWYALGERVRSATSFVADWVVPPEGQSRQVQWLPREGRAILTHNMACSPVPWDGVYNGSAGEQAMVCPTKKAALQSVKTGQTSCDTQAMQSVGTDSTNLINSCTNTNTSNCDIKVSHSEITNEHAEHCPRMTQMSTEVADENLELTSCLAENATETLFVPKMHSVACSPIFQSEKVAHPQSPPQIVYESISCSPIPVSMQDMCIQSAAEIQHAMCSPMVIASHDFHCQTETPDCVSVPCSPMLTPVQDVSIQNEIEVQSVMCSPMVPCPSQDRSVMVLGPDLQDIAVETESVELMEVGITVKPDVLTVATEMDCSIMASIATSMTPVKIGNKLGRKLTAEDIRKQHPRVVANELDTLRTENTRLFNLVQSMQRDSKKLHDQQELLGRLDEMEWKQNELQTRYDTDTSQLESQVRSLQSQMEDMQLDHQKQLAEVKEDYESRDYYDHFVSSQKLVIQLQADLENYTQLLDDMEKASKLQGNLDSALTASGKKMSATQSRIHAAAEHIKNKYKELVLDQETVKMEQLLLEDEQAKVEKERAEMAFIVSRCKDNVLQLDSQVEQLSVQLCEAQGSNTQLQEKISALKQELDKVQEENISMTTKIEELTERDSKLTEEVRELTDSSSCLAKQLQETHLSLSNSMKQYSEDKDKFAEENERQKKEIGQLQHQLDTTDMDVDMLEKDLFECREIICKQLDAIKDHTAKEAKAKSRIEQLILEKSELKNKYAALLAKKEELSSSLSSVREELSGTQQQAARLLKQQGTEIADSFTAIGQLTDHMTTFLHNLAKRHGLEMDPKQLEAVQNLGATFSGSGADISGEIKASQSHSSLVSQILQAADACREPDNEGACPQGHHGKGQETHGNGQEIGQEEKKSEHKELVKQGSEKAVVVGGGGDGKNQDRGEIQSILDTPHSVSRRMLGSSQNSAFAAIRSVKVVKDAEMARDMGDRVVNGAGSGGSQSDSEKGGGEGGDSGHLLGQLTAGREEAERLPDQVTQLSELFKKIHHTAQVIEKALWSSIHDLRLENDELSRKLSQSDYLEKRWQAEVEVKQGELDRSEARCKQLQQNLTELADLYEQSQEQEAEIKRELLEVQRLRGKVESLEGEKSVLTQQVAGLLAQVEQLSAGAAPDQSVSAQREILALQNKVEKYRDQLQKKDDSIEEISSKAARRIHKLETNWKLADAEVCRLDDLVTIIRRALRARAKTATQDEELKKLLTLIDGCDSSKK